MNILIISSSSKDIDEKYLELTKEIADCLASKEFDLVFGCCSNSMMGICYNEFAKYGRTIYSFTTEKYKADIFNLPLATSHIKETTFDLKKALFEKSDLILCLPGGVGTLSEVLSFIEEDRSNEKHVPIIIYNANNYYDSLFKQLEFMKSEKFLYDDISSLVYVIDDYDKFSSKIDEFIEKKGKN